MTDNCLITTEVSGKSEEVGEMSGWVDLEFPYLYPLFI